MRTSRRQFLRTALGSSAVISLSSSAPSFLLRAAAAEPSHGENVLVVVQLTGGNDGLNTVVPYNDDAYQASRPKLKITAETVLKMDGSFGFHPSMRGFADLYETGQLAIVQGVGYPNPNRSHFESMDIWHTCQRKSEQRHEGWLGRYLDYTAAADGSDVPAMHLGHEKQPLALAARSVRTPSIQQLNRFRLQTKGNKQLAHTIDELAAEPREQSNDLLSFVQTSTTSALAASQRVEQAVGKYRSEVQYPTSALAQKLRTIAQLIDVGLSTRIYYVTLDGFDTHAQQAAGHAALLEEFSSSVAAFTQDVGDHRWRGDHGHGKRVLVMAFSEFGRRVRENASNGTDHGAAGPMFFAGSSVKPGRVGEHPSLTDLDDGDLKFHTDFRQVYATVFEKWLGTASEAILGQKYDLVDCIQG